MNKINEGEQAYWNGKDFYDNPYDSNSVEFELWREGFLNSECVHRHEQE